MAAVRGVLDAAGVTGYEAEESGLGLLLRVQPDATLLALTALKAAGFTFLVDLFGMDIEEHIEVTYHLRSFSRDEELYVRRPIEYDGTLPSAWELYPGALLPERETAELLGLSLSGHPNPKRLLTTDAVGPLLRKSIPIRTAEEVRNR